MKYRRITKERGIRLIIDELMTINNSDDTVLLECIVYIVVVITVEGEYFNKVGHKVLSKRCEAIHLVEMVPLYPVSLKRACMKTNVLKIVIESFVFNSVFIIRHSLQEFSQFTH